MPRNSRSSKLMDKSSHLVGLDVHSRRVSVEIGFIVLGIEANRDVTEVERPEIVFDRNEHALMQTVAVTFKLVDVDLHLVCSDVFIHVEPLLRAKATAVAGRLLL